MAGPESTPQRDGNNVTNKQQQASRGAMRRAMTLLCLVVIVIGLVYFVPKLGIASSGKGFDIGSLFSGGEKKQTYSTHKVVRSDLLVTVTEDGNLESSSNIDVKCQVAGGSSILTIVKDGTDVKKGDKLVELDTSLLDDQINQQRITYEKARSTSIQAEKDFAVAKISVDEYIEGTYRKEIQVADSNITIALENLRSSQNGLDHSQRMFRKGYVSTLELESQQFSVQRANLELDAAKTTKDVLDRFTKLKMMEDLQSKVATAEAKMKSEKASLALEETKLKRLEEQLKNCLIIAPADGMVVFANDAAGGRFGGGQQTSTIEEGATVRERQTLLRLPDLANMQVKVNVHESKVEVLKPGMRARVRILERELQGNVFSIANQPEPSSWFSASVKEYATLVRIDGQPDGLKPGMTAEVEILVAHLKDIIALPVAAVVEQRGNVFCWVQNGEKTERRQLVVGLTNDESIEIKDGVKEGDEVIRNPRAFVKEAREESVEKENYDVDKKFGKGKAPDKGGESPKGSETGKVGTPAVGKSESADGKLSPQAGGGGGPGGGPARAGKGGKGNLDLTQFDKDSDGKISKEELPEQMSRMFEFMDTNKDAFIDKAEMSAARARMQQMQKKGGEGGGPPGSGGPPGGGAPK